MYSNTTVEIYPDLKRQDLMDEFNKLMDITYLYRTIVTVIETYKSTYTLLILKSNNILSKKEIADLFSDSKKKHRKNGIYDKR